MDQEENEFDSQSEVSSACSRVSNTADIALDFSNAFITRDIFDTRDELLTWARSVGRQYGIVLTITTSSNGTNGRRRPFVILACTRGGNDQKRKREIGTKKCGCPFKLKGTKLDIHDEKSRWELIVVCGIHNHHTYVENMEGKSSAADEMASVEDMSKELVKPKNTVTDSSKEKGGRSQMQLLMKELYKHNYVEWHRSCDITDKVTEVIWAHPTSISLVRNFPHVLIMDCTNRTNRFGLPLLEIVGVTSTDLKFTVAFAYLKYEKAENYEWALRRFVKIAGCPMPNVIITDRELELMKAIAVVYPSSRHMLCRRHISRDIQLANCKKTLVCLNKWRLFEMDWACLVSEVSEKSFSLRWSFMKQLYPSALSYISQKWLDPFKDRFVSVWTNTCMHFGAVVEPEELERKANYMMKELEGVPPEIFVRLKNYHVDLQSHLGSLQGSFSDNWDNINRLLLEQHTIIRSSFERSKNVSENSFKHAVFNELRGFVSIFALEKIRSELNTARNFLTVPFEMPCECSIQSTYGLPCAHKLYEFQKKGITIPLDFIDSHWKNLSMEPKPRLGEEDYLDFAELKKDFQEFFEKQDDQTKRRLLKEMRKILNTRITSSGE